MRLVKFALPLLFAAGLGIAVARAWTDRADAAARSLAVEHARAQFAQRAALVRAAPDAERYRDELKALLRTWFAEQSELANKWPALRGDAPPFVPAVAKVKVGDLGEFEDLADATVGAWREGRVDLVQTASAGGLRLDLARIAHGKGMGHLSVDAVVWGAPEELEAEEVASGKVVQHATVPVTFRGLSLRFLDKDGKLIAEMPGEGEPSLRLDLPERLAHDAPPGVILTRWEPALFPRDAAEVEWTFVAAVRSATGELRPVQAQFRTPCAPEWQVDKGEAWGGKARTLTDAELAAQKTPKPAGRAAHASR